MFTDPLHLPDAVEPSDRSDSLMPTSSPITEGQSPEAIKLPFYQKCTNPSPSGALTLDALIARIRSDQYSILIQAIRSESDRSKRESLKKRLPAVLLSAGQVAIGRKALTHSGLLQADIDKIGADTAAELRDKAKSDPHIAAAFLSPSGNGVKLIVSVPADLARHSESFAASARYIDKTYGRTADGQCKDTARLCFVSHDPDAWCKPSIPLIVDPWKVASKAANEPDTPLTLATPNDAARAALFCDRWQHEILFVPERRIWLTWEGRWQKDIAGGLKRRAIILADEVVSIESKTTSKTQEELASKKHAINRAIRLGDERVIRSMLSLAECNQSTQCTVAELDAEPWKLGTPNAVVDLRTGEAFPHRPEHRVTMFTRAKFDPNATAPRWIQFMEEVFPDAEIRHWVWKAVGYSISGDMSEEIFFVLFNSGRNGKSKFTNAIAWTLGDYADTAGTALVACDDRGGDAKREKAAIVGVRFLRAPEAEGRQRLNVRLIKDITGGDPINAEAKYEHPFTFNPVCKLWWPVNEKPAVTEVGPAIWERIRLIPFERYFQPNERDPGLEKKLRGEASGILNWLIQGCLLWQKEGLSDVPAKIAAAVAEYRKDEDTLADFIDENIEFDAPAITKHSDLFERYETWAREAGIRATLNRKMLARSLRERGWSAALRTTSSKLNWQGVALR